MAEETQLRRTVTDDGDSPAEEKKEGLSKKLLVALVILLLIGVEVGISYYINRRVVVPKYFTQTTSVKKGGIGKAAADSASPSNAQLNSNIYMLDNLVINPTGTNGTRYVSLSIGVGVDKLSILDDLKSRDIQIRDAVNTLLGKKSMGEFVNINQREELKNEILATVNDKLQPEQVKSIYFKEFVIQ